MKQSNKNIFLVLIFFLVGSLAYRFSFSKTFEIRKQLEDLEVKLANTANHYDSKAQATRIAYLDSIIARNRNTETSLQNSLLKVLNENSETYLFKIIAFKEPHSFTPQNSVDGINSYEFILEGNYKNLEQILYILERDYSFGSIAHINFRKEKDYRLNKFYLQGRILIQNIN